MIPPHLFYQIYLSFLEQNDCTPPKCGKLSEYIDSAHTEVEDLSSRYMNGSNVYDRCGHDTKQLHPSCTACRRTANLPGLAWHHEQASFCQASRGRLAVLLQAVQTDTGMRCRSMVIVLDHGAMGSQIDPSWCNKGHVMCYPVCRMMLIKEPMLLIGNSTPCSGGSRFSFLLSGWSFTICLMP